jgi:hypothetical protein
MSAVEVVAAMYDGPIPPDVLMQARAEDARYKANPARFAADEALGNVAWNTRCARECIAKIRQLIAAGKLGAADHEKSSTLCIHLNARRQYQAEARQLMKGFV